MRPPSSVTRASECGRDVSRCRTVVVRAPAPTVSAIELNRRQGGRPLRRYDDPAMRWRVSMLAVCW